MSFQLIGITGKAGAGKDTIGQWFEEEGFYPYQFSEPLKKVCAEAFGIYIGNFRGTLQEKEAIDQYWNVSHRQMLQYVGTELFRTHMEELIPGVGSDFWIRRAYKEYERVKNSAHTGMVITDVRFKNEGDLIVKNGGLLIEVVRDGLPAVGIAGHVSEAGFDKSSYGDAYALLSNNGSIAELWDHVEHVYQNFSN